MCSDDKRLMTKTSDFISFIFRTRARFRYQNLLMNGWKISMCVLDSFLLVRPADLNINHDEVDVYRTQI